MQTSARRISDAMLMSTCCCAVLVAAGCARSAPSSSRAPQAEIVVVQPITATAELHDVSGASMGRAQLTGDGDGTIHLVVHVDRMSPGAHGIHFHAVGSCERGDSTAFVSAGPHHNPLNRKHGLENPEGPHAGDLPNLVVAANGSGDLDTQTARATLRPGPATLFDTDGSAIVVHAKEDDQKTDPSGNSGARVACGVITKS